MNVLYLADPNDNHDKKWVSFFVEKSYVKAFLMPRIVHGIEWHRATGMEKIIRAPSIAGFSIFRFYRTLRTAHFIRHFIRTNNIQIVHILFAEPNALWCLFRAYFSVPLIISCRGTDVLKTIPKVFKEKNFVNFFLGPAYRLAFRKADFVTGTSYQQLQSIAAFSGRSEKMSVVRTGVELARLHADTSHFFPLEHCPPYILFPRYIKPLYNHLFCLEAIAALPVDIKQKYKMVFVGKDSSSSDALYQSKMLEKMHSMPDVSFEFLTELKQEEIFELYKRSSLVVMTPLSDGSPVSAMEAIASGCKVIVGPLKYDDEIFKKWTYQLTSWDNAELMNLMVHCLQSENRTSLDDYFPLVDQNIEMSKIVKLYNDFDCIDKN